VGFPFDLGRLGHAAGNGKTIAEAAGRHFQAVFDMAAGVAGQDAVITLERVHLLPAQVASLHEGSVVGQAGMALAHDKAVALKQAGILGIMVHDAKIEAGDNLDTRQGRAKMSPMATGGITHFQAIAPHCRSFLTNQVHVNSYVHLSDPPL